MTVYEGRRRQGSDLAPFALQRQHRWQPVDIERNRHSQPYSQGALALTFTLAAGLDAEPTSTALSVVAEPATTNRDVPDPEDWAARFLQAVVEVVSSDRPLTQLARWTDGRVFADISRRRQLLADRRQGSPVRTGRPQIATVHVFRPSPRVAEIAARVSAGSRSRALAARLDFSRGRWLCTGLEFG